MTALTGGNISEESFAISTAILAAPYAAFQADSLDDPGSLGAESMGSMGSEDGEIIDRATALDEATSALWSFVRGWNVASPCLMYSVIRGVGVRGGLLGGVPDDEDFFRKWRMVNGGQQRVHVQMIPVPQGAQRFSDPSSAIIHSIAKVCGLNCEEIVCKIENVRWGRMMEMKDERFLN